MGLLEIMAGIIVFGRPVASAILTAGFLVYFIAFIAMFFGFMGIITGIRVRKEIKGEWSMIVGGLLAVIFGFLLLINPQASALALIITMGCFAFVGGIFQIFFAFKLRKVGKKVLEVSV